MSETVLPLLAGFLAGAFAGGMYFAALWLSVRRLTEGDGGLRGLALGAGLRLGVLLAGLGAALALGVPGPVILAAALGFVLARLAVTRLAPAPDTAAPFPGRAKG